MAYEIALRRQVGRRRYSYRQEIARAELNAVWGVRAIGRTTVVLEVRLTLERVPKESVLATARSPSCHLLPLDRHQKYPARAPISPKVVAKKIDPKNDSALARLSIGSLCGNAGAAEG